MGKAKKYIKRIISSIFLWFIIFVLPTIFGPSIAALFLLIIGIIVLIELYNIFVTKMSKLSALFYFFIFWYVLFDETLFFSQTFNITHLAKIQIISVGQLLFLLLATLFLPLFDKKMNSKTSAYLFIIALVNIVSLRNILIIIFESSTIGAQVNLYLFILFISVSFDVFSFVFGLFCGKHKLIPHISPNKTWEGAISGFVIATIVGIISAYALFIPQLMHWNFWQLIILITTIIVFSLMGDLIFSSFKRELKIKDFSTFIPGHGGILDRIDSIFFAFIGYFLFTLLLQVF